MSDSLPAVRDSNAWGLADTLSFFVKYCIWCFFSVVANTESKIFFATAGSLPVALLWAQLTCGSIGGFAYLLVRRQALILSAGEALRTLWLPIMLHLVGNLATNISLSLSGISFTHTIKSAEPLASAALSTAVLGTAYNAWMYASLLVIACGICLASMQSLQFSWRAVCWAAVSNGCFASRNVLCKKTVPPSEVFVWVSLFGWLAATLALSLEARAINALAATSASAALQSWHLASAAASHAVYNIASFAILATVAPVAHAVGNVTKRLVILFSGVFLAGEAITRLGGLGVAVAVGGILWFSLLKLKQ